MVKFIIIFGYSRTVIIVLIIILPTDNTRTHQILRFSAYFGTLKQMSQMRLVIKWSTHTVT